MALSVIGNEVGDGVRDCPEYELIQRINHSR